ncbi:MAG TPA: hypothetical protein VHR64_05665 [Thermomicrobiales bacterium]|jgi:hypothetical protein|nr:hypothetical protein [Thermomicrobiales bacterium]
MTVDLMSRQLNRRQFAIGSAASLAALNFLPSHMRVASAQAAGDFSAMGYPELAITMTDTGFENVPKSTEAGRYLLKLTSNLTSNNNGGAIGLFSPTAAGVSVKAALKIIGAAGAAEATPAGGMPEATPMAGTPEAGGEQGQQIPLSIYRMYFAGGVAAAMGETGEAVIDLIPGNYIVWGDDPSAPQKPSIMKVTGDFPKRVKDPTADITATLIDFAITMEGSLTAGKHIMKVQHHGAQPHFLEIEKGPDSMTKEQVMSTFSGMMSGTPPAEAIPESEMQSIFFSPTQSIGTTTWQMIDLTDGTFLAACFFPTAGTGLPHAFNGMVDVFKVTG